MTKTAKNVGMLSARQVAYEVLMRVERDNAYANLSLKTSFRKHPLTDRDKGLCTEIVYGTIGRKRSLDELLKPFLKRGLSEVQDEVKVLLRMSIYQCVFLDRVPPYAAINESVEITKRVLPRAAGFVNGVLRAFLRDDTPLSKRLEKAVPPNASVAERLGIVHSYPTWLVERFLSVYGEERTVSILEASNSRPEVSLRVNRLKATADDVVAGIEAAMPGAVKRSLVSADGLRMDTGVDMEHWPFFTSGQVTVQDEAAMLIAPLLQPGLHDRVLDMCAAPGTKTTHIAELQHDQGYIDACDLHAHKLRLIQQSTTRLGLSSIHTVWMDGRLLAHREDLVNSYDAVLLDAPCSGLGVLRHRPEIRWHRTLDDVHALVKLQRELLVAASRLLRPGGVIVYSTCTLLPEENENLIADVLRDEGIDLVEESIEADVPEDVWEHAIHPAHGLLLPPDTFGTDGFFMARLRKSE